MLLSSAQARILQGFRWICGVIVVVFAVGYIVITIRVSPYVKGSDGIAVAVVVVAMSDISLVSLVWTSC